MLTVDGEMRKTRLFRSHEQAELVRFSAYPRNKSCDNQRRYTPVCDAAFTAFLDFAQTNMAAHARCDPYAVCGRLVAAILGLAASDCACL